MHSIPAIKFLLSLSVCNAHPASKFKYLLSVDVTHILLRAGDKRYSQEAVGLTSPLSRQYRATESSIVGSSPNNSFCFCLSWLT